jgi:hypothetical protein
VLRSQRGALQQCSSRAVAIDGGTHLVPELVLDGALRALRSLLRQRRCQHVRIDDPRQPRPAAAAAAATAAVRPHAHNSQPRRRLIRPQPRGSQRIGSPSGLLAF